MLLLLSVSFVAIGTAHLTHAEFFVAIMPLFALYARLPVQFLFMAWVWWAARLDAEQ